MLVKNIGDNDIIAWKFRTRREMTLGAKLVTHGHNRIRLLKIPLFRPSNLCFVLFVCFCFCFCFLFFLFFFFCFFIFISIVTYNLKARIISWFETSPRDSWILFCNYLYLAIFDNFPILPPNFVLNTN